MSTFEHDSDASSLDLDPPQEDEGDLQDNILEDINAPNTSLLGCGDPESQDDVLDTEVTLAGDLYDDEDQSAGEALA